MAAVFVIDIQKEMAGIPSSSIPRVDRLKANSEKVLSAARDIVDSNRNKSEKSPSILIFVQHEDPAGSGGLENGTEKWELVFPPRENTAEEILVPKTHPDTFESNPGLVAKLKSQGVTKIFTFGIQSDMCVEHTSKGALKAGFDVTVLSGAHSTYDAGGKTAEEIEREVEKRLQEAGAHIVPFEDVVARWKKENLIC